MIKKGHNRVSVILGGFEAWTREGLPTQSTSGVAQFIIAKEAGNALGG